MKDEKQTIQNALRETVGNTDSNEKLIQLMTSYENLVFSICLKMCGDYFAAQDITQETFISAFEHLESLSEGSEKAWICRIASNKCIDYLKSSERKTTPTPDTEMPENVTSRDGPLETFVAKDVYKEFTENCNALPDNYKEAARMHFIDGLTAKEISLKTGVPLKNVQTRIYRAREMLKTKMRKEDFLS